MRADAATLGARPAALQVVVLAPNVPGAAQAPAISAERAIAREAAHTPGRYGEQRERLQQLARERGVPTSLAERLFNEEVVRKALRDARETGYVAPNTRDILASTKWSGGGWSMIAQGGDKALLRAPSGETALVDVNTGQAFFLERRPDAVVAPAAPAAPEGVALVPGRPQRMEGPETIERLIPLAGIVFGSITLISLAGPFVRAWVKRLERRWSAQAPATPEVTARFDRLEQAVEAVAIEVERIGEAQRYQTRMFAERAPAALPADGGDAAEPPRREGQRVRTPPEGVAR